MTVAQQLATRAALVQLRTNTLNFLQNTPFTAGGLQGNDTTATQLSFALHNGDARMGSAAFLMATHPVGATLHQIDAYATPMRLANLLPARTAATARFAAGAGPDIWVTTRQTGCSVLILDWGGSLSMVHLQPFGQGAFWFGARAFMSLSNYTNRETLRYSLQSEFNAVVAASRGVGPAPQRYILAQSTWTVPTGHFLGVTGVRAGGIWRFYLQDYNAGGVFNAVQLNWTNWNHWGPYDVVSY